MNEQDIIDYLESHPDFFTHQPYNVRMISYGASTNNICMLVQSEHADEVARSLHKSLFE